MDQTQHERDWEGLRKWLTATVEAQVADPKRWSEELRRVFETPSSIGSQHQSFSSIPKQWAHDLYVYELLKSVVGDRAGNARAFWYRFRLISAESGTTLNRNEVMLRLFPAPSGALRCRGKRVC